MARVLQHASRGILAQLLFVISFCLSTQSKPSQALDYDMIHCHLAVRLVLCVQAEMGAHASKS